MSAERTSKSAARPASRKGPRTLWQIFAVPIGIALVSLVGLVAALTGDGLPDLVSWLGLAVPVAAFAWAWRSRRS